MNIWDFLLLLLIAAIIGALGQALAGYSLPGLGFTIVAGFVGAWLGKILVSPLMVSLFKFSDPLPVSVAGRSFPVVSSVIGAVGLVLAYRLIAHVVSGRRSRV